MRWWRKCVVVMCAVEKRGGEMTRLEPQDLSVTVELGLCLCSRLLSDTVLYSTGILPQLYDRLL